MTKNPNNLLSTPLMRATRGRQIWGKGAKSGALPQMKLPMTGEAVDANALIEAFLAAERKAYGPRKNRNRWCDMGAKLPAWVQTGTYRLTEATKAVLFTILHDMPRAGGDGVSVAFGAIAAYAGVSDKTVERSIKILEALGLIEVTRGGWSNRLNRKVANVYRIADQQLRHWWRKFFKISTDKYGADPIPSKIPVNTEARQWVWGEASPAQTEAARLAASALGENGDPWAFARTKLVEYGFSGLGVLAERHGFNALLAALHLELRVTRDPTSLNNPRGFLRALLSKAPAAYQPFPSIRKEIMARTAF